MANPIDIFGGSTRFGSAYSADNAVITFPGITNLLGSPIAGMLIQSIQGNWARPITRFYELGSNKFYYVGQRPAGECTLARIVGPGQFLLKFYEQFADICQADKNNFELQAVAACNKAEVEYAGQQGGQGQAYMFKAAVITNLSISTTAELAIMNENVQMIYTGMSIDEGVHINVGPYYTD